MREEGQRVFSGGNAKNTDGAPVREQFWQAGQAAVIERMSYTKNGRSV